MHTQVSIANVSGATVTASARQKAAAHALRPPLIIVWHFFVLLWQIVSLVSGMQSFEASAELQPGWARFLHAWKNMAPTQCAAHLL